MPDSFVQVAADGAGKKIRNKQTETGQPDGTTATVQEQVVRLTEADRRLLEALEYTLRRQLAATTLMLAVLVGRTTKISENDIAALADTL